MIIIFSIPKAFDGQNNIIQRNALKSWLLLKPKCEIILFGNDEGVAEAAGEFGVLHIPDIDKNEFGTPLLDSAFNLARQKSSNNILAYINADIILTQDFISAIKLIDKPIFLASGRRWDLDIKEELDFHKPDWQDNLLEQIRQKGKLHGYTGIDYLIFPRKFDCSIPAFAVGRPGWDNWLIWQTRSHKIPVIDATGLITVIHQNHDYSHSKFGQRKRVSGPEAKRNLKLAGGFLCMLTLLDADWILDVKGLRRPGFPRLIFAMLSLFYPWRFFFLIKRKLQNLFRELYG